MNVLKSKLVPFLFALGGVAWLVPAVKQLIKGEPLNVIYITSATSCFLFAVIFRAVCVAAARKSEGGSAPPSA